MTQVQCPNCQKVVVWSKDSPFRPFCSERCRIIDLGAWGSGEYAIPVKEEAPSVESQNETELIN